MIELWKTVPGYPDYAVSNLGHIKRLTSRTCAKAGALLKTPARSRRAPYPAVDLCLDGKRKTFAVHQLVAESFVAMPEGGPFEVNHIDGDKRNPVSSNLEWTTSSENKRHAYREGLSKAHGEHNGQAKLTERDVLRVRSSSVTDESLAADLHVSPWTIKDVRARKTWTHI